MLDRDRKKQNQDNLKTNREGLSLGYDAKSAVNHKPHSNGSLLRQCLEGLDCTVYSFVYIKQLL